MHLFLLLTAVSSVAGWTTVSQMRGDPVAESLDVIKSNNGAIHRLWNFPRQNGWANDGNSPTGAHAFH